MDDAHHVLVKPQVGRLTRTVITFLGLCHLVLVAAVPSAVALTTSTEDYGWVMWLLVPSTWGCT